MPMELAMNDAEQWKPVVGFETHYEVSNAGRVRRLYPEKSTYRGRLLKFGNHNGYNRVTLNVFSSVNKRLVHRLVADAFLAASDKPYINHKDGNPANNHADNLEWVTAKENVIHAWAHGLSAPLRGERHGCHVLTESAVAEIRALRSQGKLLREIAPLFGVTETTVSHIVRGITWRSAWAA